MDTCEIVFFAANPAGTGQLALDKEVREIESKIRAASHRDNLKLISKWAVRPDDLLQALNQHDATIMHFSGHGSAADEIILAGNDGQSKPVSKAAMSALLKTLRGRIRLVILNACFSRPQAEGITEHIDYAIGMNKAVGDDAAIIFAASVYQAIGFGKSVQEAFDQGIVALLLEGIPEANTPELLCKAGVDPKKVYLLSPPVDPPHQAAPERGESGTPAETTEPARVSNEAPERSTNPLRVLLRMHQWAALAIVVALVLLGVVGALVLAGMFPNGGGKEFQNDPKLWRPSNLGEVTNVPGGTKPANAAKKSSLFVKNETNKYIWLCVYPNSYPDPEGKKRANPYWRVMMVPPKGDEPDDTFVGGAYLVKLYHGSSAPSSIEMQKQVEATVNDIGWIEFGWKDRTLLITEDLLNAEFADKVESALGPSGLSPMVKP